MSFAARQHRSYDPVSPTDFTGNLSAPPPPRASEERKNTNPLNRTRTSSSSSTAPSLRTPRQARFAEATAVHSPIDPSPAGRSPFADPPNMASQPGARPSDVGFGYIAANDASRHATFPAEEHASNRLAPPTPGTPLRSALRSPGTPGRRFENPLSPTFREEQILEKHEASTEKENAKDLVSIPWTYLTTYFYSQFSRLHTVCEMQWLIVFLT